MSLARISLLLFSSAAAAGCTSIRAHQGFVADPVLIASVQPGVDNRESVQGTLGRPTFTGQFDQRDWYYVSRETKQLAFARPSASARRYRARPPSASSWHGSPTRSRTAASSR